MDFQRRYPTGLSLQVQGRVNVGPHAEVRCILEDGLGCGVGRSSSGPSWLPPSGPEEGREPGGRTRQQTPAVRPT
eukprot:9404227-Alexandrium_andersonii.AAC.1